MKKNYSLLTAMLVAMLLIPWQLNAIVISENFDNLTSLPDGWTVEGTASSEYHWQIYDSYDVYGGSGKSLYFYSYWASSGSSSILKIPFSLSGETKEHFLKFAAQNRDYGTYKVFISTDGGVTYSTLLQEVGYSYWTEYEISLAAYTGQSNLCIVFENVSGWSANQYMDNFEIAPAPTCAVAAEMFITDQEQAGALLNWKLATGKGAAATEFAVAVYAVGAETPVFAKTVGATGDDAYELEAGVYSYFVEGLTPGSAYYFTVKGICGAGDEAALATSATFYTTCNSFALPILIDTITESAMIPCWTLNDADISDGTLYLNSARSFVATPVLTHAANDIEVSLAYIGTSKDKGFYYGVASNASLSDFDTLGYVKHTATYAQQSININTAGTKFGNNTGKVFAIRPDEYMYVTAIDVHAKPCCPRIEQPMASAIDSASINLSWLGTASIYSVILKDTVSGDLISRTVTTNPVVINNLAPQTTYLVLVQAMCEGCEVASEISDSIYVTTLCGVADATFTESFEYSELGSVLPECWIQNKADAWIVNHNISYYDTPNKAADGRSAIYMYSSTYYGVPAGQTATFSPQPFNVTSAGQYDVSFAMYRYSAGYYGQENDGTLTVWANNRPDTAGAVKVATIDRYYTYSPVEKAEGWYYYDFNIPTITGTVYLIFEGKQNGSNNLYLDDIKVYPAPTCRKVRQIELGEPTTETVPLKWVAEEDQKQWIVKYVVTMGTDIVKSDSLLTSSNPYVIEGLNPSNAYKVTGTVQGYCSETDKAEAIAFEYDFQTACVAFAVPFVESFDATIFPPMCWQTARTAGDAGEWRRTSSVYHTGAGSAELADKREGNVTILVTPELSIPAEGTYRISYWMKRHTYGKDGEGVRVWVNNHPNLTDAIELGYTNASIDFDETPGTAGWVEIKYDIDINTVGQFKYVIFEGINKYYSSLQIDDISVGPKPEVDIIWSFSVDSIDITTAQVVVPDTAIAAFDIIYGLAGFDLTSENNTVVENIAGGKDAGRFAIKNLNPATEYEVYVRSRKGDKVSAWSSVSVKFRTLCSAFVVSDENPFVEDFESYSNNDVIGGCMLQSYSSSYTIKAVNESDYYSSSDGYIDILPKSGEVMAYIGSSYGSGSWLFRALDLKAGQNYSISVYALDGGRYEDVKISMGYATTPDRDAVTKCVSAKTVAFGSKGWERIAGYFSVPADGVYYVGVGFDGSSSDGVIDSLVIRTEKIVPPAVEITDLSDNSVTFQLTSDAASWNMYYFTETFAPDTIATELLKAVTEKSYTINNLASNTTYYYAFISYDSEGNASSWTGVSSFKTQCGAVDLPLVQGFESLNLDCWTLNTTGDGEAALRAYASGKHSGSYSWNIYGSHKLISPKVNGDLSNVEGSFWAVGQYSGDRYTAKFVVGVMTNPLDPTTYKAVTDTIVIAGVQGTDPITEYTFSLTSLKEDEAYKNAQYVVLEMIQGYAFIDDFTVDLLPTCPRPTDFVATAVTANSVTLDWVAGGLETSWNVLVLEGNDTIQNITTSTHPMTVSGLSGYTAYDFKLSALCSADDNSKVVELSGVRTECGIYALPYEDDLNGMPDCWIIDDTNENDRWSWSTYAYGYISLSSQFADSYEADTARLYSAQFNFDKTYNLSIEMQTYYPTGTFNILFDNGTTRDTLIANYQSTSTENYDTVTIDMSAYKGQTGRLVFEGWGPIQTSYFAAWYLRNLTFTEKYEAPAAPAVPTIQYGGGYFTADNLPVAVITTETRPNYILVTVDGSEPSFEGVMTGATAPVPSGTQIPMTAESTTLKARGFLLDEYGQPYQTPAGEYIYSEVVSATFNKVSVPAAPEFTPVAGEYVDSVRVSIACATENVVIKYAFGGLEPTGKSATYTESFLLTDSAEVSAIAYLTDAQGAPIMDVEGMPIASAVTKVLYGVNPYVAPVAPAVPTIQYGGGYFTADSLFVALTTTETRPNYILVTIDGSEPTVEGIYTGTTFYVPSGQQIPMIATTILKARVMLFTEAGAPYQTPKGEYIYSEVVSATFTKVEAPKAPEFTPVAGEYFDSVRVSIACATENVMIKYALGGSEPTGKSATYTESFLFTDTTIVSAIAYLTDALGTPIMDVENMPIASEVVFAEYKVAPYVAPAAPAVPTIQYGGGYFTADNLPVAIITTETRPNYILVTIDGSEPSFEGVYAGTTLPIASGQQIPMTAASTTIKARGFLLNEEGQPYQTPAGEYIYSEVVSATFNKVEAPKAPEFTPAAGEYVDSVRVSIACATENVMIKYAFGGSEPTGKSATYTESFLLTDTTIVSAIAYLTDAQGAPIMDVEGMPIASEVVFAEYLVEPSQGVDVDNVEVAAIVYAKDGMVYVDTEVGNMIEVFTVQGQRIYAAEATAQLTTIDAYAADIVLVRVNGETIKVSVR